MTPDETRLMEVSKKLGRARDPIKAMALAKEAGRLKDAILRARQEARA